MDFTWSGASETLQFRVGDRTADVNLPEIWTDDDGNSVADSSDHDNFRSPSDQTGGYSLSDIAERINAAVDDGGAGDLVKATVETDSASATQTLTIRSLSGEALQVTSFPQADSNERGQWAAMESVSAGMVSSTPIDKDGSVVVKFSGGETHTVAVSSGQTVSDVVSNLSTIPGLWAGVRGNGIALVSEGETEPFSISTDLDLFVQAVYDSSPVEGNNDMSHTGLASLLGFQTAVTGTEVAGGKIYNTDADDPNGEALDIRFVSGSNSSELKIDDDAELTLEEFATRLRGVAGDWLEVIVETDTENPGIPLENPEGNIYYPTEDKEGSSQRLVLRTRDGSPLNIYDVAGGDYAAQLGIGTAQTTVDTSPVAEGGDGPVWLPADVSLERPARVGIEVGGEMFEVRLFSDQISSDGSWVDMDSVARQILEQVGSDNISVDISDDGDSFSLYSPLGEPLRVVDLAYADSDMGGKSSGLAAAMGIQSGVTGELVESTDTLPGNFMISTGTGARSVSIAVKDGDTLSVVAEKIREQAGSWLDVSISYDAETLTEQRISLSAQDGSALSIYGLTGSAARGFGLNTDVRTEGVVSWSAGDTLDITVDGYTHILDLTGVTDLDALSDLVNARFPGMDVQAGALDTDDDGTDDALTFYSPRGKSIELNQTGGTMTFSNAGSTENRGGSGPNGQNVVVRTGGNVEESDLFGILADLASAVRQGDVEGISNSLLPELDQGLDDVLQARSYCGALEVRYTAAQTRLTDDKVALTDLYSRVMDVDMAEAAMEFQTSQAIYQATLAVMSKAIQPTLVDYLT
jgi:flagellar hook-associated protein 3 FlgL